MAISLPKGTHDVILDEAKQYTYIESIMKSVADKYGYSEMRTPVIEHTELFQRSAGESSDVVRKEMYTFNDKGDRSITLRPEITAGCMRSIVQNKLYATVQDLPIKSWYLGPAFRYERPQAGRYRQFNQFGIESVGVNNFYHDVEVIMMGYTTLMMLGLKDVTIKINSLGDKESRDAYRDALKEFFKDKVANMCEDCKQRYEINPLRILDCKVPEDQEIAKGAPVMKDYLTPAAKDYFNNILRLLDAYKIKYEIDDNLVRGLDYYSHVVFEFHYTSKSGKNLGAIGAGGHYDNLVAEVGGPDMAGVGLAFGIERVQSIMADEGLLEGIKEHHDISVMCLEEQAMEYCYDLATAFRASGLKVDMLMEPKGFKQQFKRAERKNSDVALIVGGSELEKGVVVVRDLHKQEQIEVAQNEIFGTVMNILRGGHQGGCGCGGHGHHHGDGEGCCGGHHNEDGEGCCEHHDESEEHECCCKHHEE